MEWLDKLNDAMDYVEQNIDGEITSARASQIAACSEYHFQRVFAYIAEMTFAEYVRRRRMTAAAFDLIDGREKVIDIAAKYGYNSPTAFNRAFQNIHGVAPTAAKSEGVRLTAFPRITFTLKIKGDTAMDYKIEKRPAIRIVGIGTTEPLNMEDCLKKIPLFWDKVVSEGGIEKICALIDGSEPAGILGVSLCQGEEFSGYYIAAATNAPVPEGMSELVIPECTWAIFDCAGPMPGAIQELQRRIISEWLPTSGYEYADAPDIEVYTEGDQHSADYKSQVWLPIAKV
ncbi:MAG: AraC family transcriptional regulator [Clostridia bacterium]|nr:AraC family transcriptional regulator [Clostridia bacterium]